MTKMRVMRKVMKRLVIMVINMKKHWAKLALWLLKGTQKIRTEGYHGLSEREKIPGLPSVNPRLELVFSHSEQQSPLTSPPSGQVPLQPSDLPHFICPSPRPILKPTTAPILVKEEDNTGEEEEEVLEIPEPFEDPCSSMVLEKPAKENIVSEDLVPKEEEEEETPKKVSKFKAMRAGRK